MLILIYTKLMLTIKMIVKIHVICIKKKINTSNVYGVSKVIYNIFCYLTPFWVILFLPYVILLD